MKRAEAVRLLAYCAMAAPSMRIEEGTAEVWHDLLQDLNVDDALDAARHHLRLHPYVGPADIRRAVATRYNLLAPDFGRAWYILTTYAVEDTAPSRTTWHPAVAALYAAVGKAEGVRRTGAEITARKVYEGLQREYDEDMLTSELGDAVVNVKAVKAAMAHAERAALEKGGER